MKKFVTGILGSAALALSASAASAATLDDVKAKGFLQCGVNTSLAGFSAPNDKGEWTGLDVDFCRAVAAAGRGRFRGVEDFHDLSPLRLLREGNAGSMSGR